MPVMIAVASQVVVRGYEYRVRADLVCLRANHQCFTTDQRESLHP